MPHDQSPGARVVGERSEPAFEAADLVGPEQPTRREDDFGNGEERGQRESLFLEHRGEVVTDLPDRLGGDTVKNDRH